MKNTVILYLLLLFSLPAFSQEDTLQWNADRPLTWDDFKGEVDESEELSAMTHSELQALGYMKEGYPFYEITVVFKRSDSWTRGSGNEGLLHHEQLHFDITELYGRKIRRKIAELRKAKEKSPEPYQEAIGMISAEWKKEQVRYDEESDHGRNAAKQKEWEEKILKELRALETYSGN